MTQKQSMFKRILIVLTGVALLDGLIFISFIYFSNSIQQMRTGSASLFEERLRFRASELQKILTSDLYETSNFTELNEACDALYKEKSQFSTDVKLKEHLLEELNDFLEMKYTTGAYVIFDKDVFQSSAYPAFYLRDTNPDATFADKSDIIALYGEPNILKGHNYTLDRLWKPSIALNAEDRKYDFYFKPIEAAKQNRSLEQSNLGYWGEPIFLNDEDNNEVITYSIPLFSEDKEVYGIIGVEFSIDYLNTYLNYLELNNQEKNSYVIAQKVSDDEYRVLFSNGPAYQYALKKDEKFILEDKDDIYRMKSSAIQEDTAVASRILDLYDSNTPFVDNGWYLMGVVDENQLYNTAFHLMHTMSLAMAAALILGSLIAVYASLRFTKPISKLSQSLKNVDPNAPIELPQVKIAEIDELSKSIVSLSKNLSSAESRLAQVVHSLDMPIGAIEIIDDNTIYCTEKIPYLLNFSLEDKNVYTTEEFNAEIENFKNYITLYDQHEEVQDEKSVKTYVVQYTLKEQDISKWLRFIISDHKGSGVIVVTDVSDEIEEKQRLTYERDHDVLTQLYNRRAFRDRVEKILKQDKIGICAMMLWDLDNLKFINDTYGHDAGDRLICTTADALHTLSSSRCIVSRMAGDEFLVFFHHFTSKAEIRRLIEQKHMQINQLTLEMADHTKVKIRVSAGLSWYQEDGSTFDELSKCSDFAMYDVKNYQKGGIREFDIETYHNDKLLFNGRKELNDLIENKLVKYAYQPIVDAHSGEIFGFEALMRPQGTVLKSPSDVMRLARAQSMLYRIEFMTWTSSLEQFASKADSHPNAKLFLNSIPSIPMLEDLIYELESQYASMLPRLVVELLETDEIEQRYLETKQKFVEKWHAQMAIDDFGSGYSNDSTLLRFAASYIKIDMEFIQGIAEDQDRQKLVANMIQYAHEKDILVIAEGIERYEDMAYLITHGIDYLQGYYLSKPSFELTDLPDELKKEIRELHK